MMRRIVMVVVSLLVVGLAAAVVLGPTALRNLVFTGRKRIDKAVNEYVDPEVVFQNALRQAEEELPRRIASLRMAQGETEKQLEIQARLAQEDRQALALVKGDLKVLAPVVVARAAQFELRARKFASAAEVQAEVQRLLRKRHHRSARGGRTRRAGAGRMPRARGRK